ncbi:MAG: sulfotransferase family 2 domain-containing protein [Prolixibacteraceae bacterium]|nr:sulfotransferase family 2 domain-containing protein [Prolixibacteraceae bacterium]
MKEKHESNKISDGIEKIKEIGFWFVDIPRTSSSSIRIELYKQYGFPFGKMNLLDQYFSSSEQVFMDHLTALQMSKMIGVNEWKKLFTFSIVRNPWDRTYSIFCYRKKKKNIPTKMSFSEYLRKLERANEETPFFEYHGFRFGAAEYLLDENNSFLINEFVKFENREIGLKKISDILKIKEIGILNLQKATPNEYDYKKQYTFKTKKIIRKIYKKDIELFDYQFK